MTRGCVCRRCQPANAKQASETELRFWHLIGSSWQGLEIGRLRVLADMAMLPKGTR